MLFFVGILVLNASSPYKKTSVSFGMNVPKGGDNVTLKKSMTLYRDTHDKLILKTLILSLI